MKLVKFDLSSGQQTPADVPVALTPAEEAKRASAITQALILVTKMEARRRILAIIPEWKQANATARAVEIVNARLSGTATPADLAELGQLAAMLAVVKSIRAASDLIEDDIAAGGVGDERGVCNSSHWPVL